MASLANMEKVVEGILYLDLRQEEMLRFQSGWEGGKAQLSGRISPGLAWTSRTGAIAEVPSSLGFPRMPKIKKSQARAQRGQDNLQVECFPAL